MLFGISITFAIAVLVYVVFLVTVLYIFVYADPGDSPIAEFFTETLPTRSWALLEKILGPRTLYVVEFFVDRFLLLVYCTVVFGPWSIIFAYVYPWADRQTYVSTYHKYIGVGVFLACVASWRYTTISSPGVVTKKNFRRYDHYPYDNLLFVPGLVCKTTGVPRVARSKYDRFKYKAVVPRYDHFCGWVHNTIGEENYRFFLLFLFIHVAMCAYGSTILCLLFYGEILDQGLFEVVFFDRYTGEEFKPGYWIIFQYLFNRRLLPATILVLTAVMAVALGLFLAYHIWLTSRGMTTNEASKWDQIRKWHKESLKNYNDAIKRGEVVPSDSLLTGDPIVSDGDVTCPPMPSQTAKVDLSSHTLQHPGPEPKNIYDRGFVENWKEILFPITLRSSALTSEDGKPKGQ